jgi:hypothetical protein
LMKNGKDVAYQLILSLEEKTGAIKAGDLP